MIPDFIHGCIAPVFTAFNEDGTLDDAGQRNLLSFLQARGGISAYFIRSGMGQTYTFSYEDARQIAKTACDHMKGETVLVGASGIWDRDYDRRPEPQVYTRQAMDLAKFAEQQGATGVVYTMPEALVPERGETIADIVLRYFETVSTATTLPILIYQPPGTANEYRVTVDLIRKLADLPSIKGMKVSTTDAEYILDLTWAVAGKDFGYIVGAETAFYAGLCSGARAVIGQGAAINPQILNAVQDRFDQRDYEGAIEAQRAANLLVQEAVETVTFFKRYATEQGYPIKPHRRATAREGYAEQKPKVLTDDRYETYKNLLESELAKYV
jgi:N-acetylneuraminate lyase